MKKLTIALLFLLVLVFSISKIYSYDIWYHLGAGRYVLEAGNIPQKNIFSYTQPDHEWIDIQWLFQVVAYGVHSAFGFDGLIVLKSLGILLAFAILFRTCYRGERIIVTAVFFYLAILCSQERFFVRPEIFSLPLFATYLKILSDDEKRPSNMIYILPVLQILWVNVQGLFVLGLVLVSFHLISRASRGEIRRPALLLLLCIAACFINPYTYRGALFPLILFKRVGHFSNVFTSTIAEFISPLPTHHPMRLLKIFISLKSYTLSSFLALAGLTLITFILNIRRTNLFLLLSYIAFLYLSASAKRNLPLFAFVSCAAAVYNLNSFLNSSEGGKRISTALSKSPLGKSACAILMVLTAITIFLVVTDNFAIHEKSTRSFGFGVSSSTYAVGAMNFIIDKGVTGNVFNTLSTGGYFLWRCYPGRRDFIDGRLEAISDEFYAFYISLLRNPDRWPECVRKYGVTYAILDHWVNPEDALLYRIYRDDAWALVYLDGSSAVFLLRNSENTPIIERHEIDPAKLQAVAPPAEIVSTNLSRLTDRWVRKKKFPFLEFTLGNFYSAIGMNDKAIEYYTKGLGVVPDEAALYNNIGICRLRQNRMAEAIGAFKRALDAEPTHLQAMKNLGSTYSTMGDVRNALYYWEMAYRLDPSDTAVKRSLKETRRRLLGASATKSKTWLLLRTGLQLEDSGNIDAAIDKYREAVAILPEMPQARYQLGLAYSRKGVLEDADRQFREVIRLKPDDSRAYHNLAAICQKRGMDGEAIKHYLSALAIDPESVPTNFNLALLYYETGKKKKAKKHLLAIRKLDPDFADAKKLLDKLK